MLKKSLLLVIFIFHFSGVSQDDDGFISDAFFQGTEIIAGTEFPFQIGAKLKIQLPSNIHMTAGLGYSPEFYSEAYGSMAGSTGILGEKTAEIAVLPFAGALILDARAAYSLDPDGGLFAELGYAFITGGGGSTTGDVVEAAYDFDYSGYDQNDSLNVEGSIHALTVHLGFLYLMTEQLSLIIDVGVIKPMIADLEITAKGVPAATASQIESDLQSYLEDAMVSEMFIPTGSVWFSYLF